MTRRTIIHRGLSLATLVVACLAASLLSATPADAAGPRPDFRSPWPCGEQRQYYHHSSEVLNALDFSLPGGADFNTPVLAPAAGTVEVVHGHAGYGNYVRIHHTGGWASMMAHLHTTSVADGQYVQVGQEIGRVGSTGNSTGPHLHLEQEADGTNHPIILDGVALRYSGAVSHHTSRNCGGSGVSGQAFVFGGSQRFAGVDVSGSLTNFSWSPGTGVVRSDWGGGAVTGVPVGYVHDGLQHVFARGTDDTLRHWYQSGTHPPGLDSWNTTGLVKSDPAGFAYGTQQHVFFRNPQNRLEHRYYDTTTGQVHGGVWSDHTFTGNPYAFVHRDQQHVFARTAEGALLHWYWWPGIAPAVDDWGITTGIASDITGFSYHGTQHHIFYRDTDGHLQHRYYDDASGTLNGGTWPGGTFEGDPHALVHRDQQHVFARNTQGDLVHWYWWPGINPAVDDWGAQNTVTGDPVGLSTPGQHHVFYRTTNGTLAHHWIDDGHHTPHHDNWGGNITP